MADEEQEMDYVIKLREEEEMEFFMDLAIHETERWIQAVTKKTLQCQDDTRKSLENGVLLCELLNCLQPGVIKRVNRLPTPIAGLDNINVFLKTCKSKFGLTDAQLFNPSDLEDLSQRAIA
ncbi:LIM domain only protein 7, partial [Bulinus truncatus]